MFKLALRSLSITANITITLILKFVVNYFKVSGLKSTISFHESRFKFKYL